MKFVKFILLIAFLQSCERSKNNVVINSDFYDKAYSFVEKDLQDSAFINFEKAKIEFQKNNDSLKIAKCYTQMATIQCKNGDYFGSEEQSVNAIKFSNTNDSDYKEVLISSFNNIGIVKLNLKEYENGIIFFKIALSLSTDTLNKTFALNNLAVAYQHSKKYDEALNIYNKILSLNNSLSNNASKIKSNIAYVNFLKNPAYTAEEELVFALKNQTENNDLWGQNASHAHLSDFYGNKNPQKSLYHAHEMYKTATELKSPDDRLEALQKLVQLENPKNSKKYFSQFQQLNDSLQIARAKAKNQFALIRYETEKNKADLQQAQAENESKQNRLILSYIITAVLLGMLVTAVFWYKKRKIRLEQQKQLEVKNTELKYSKKVHDVVANGLYQAMVEVENQPEIDREDILNKLEVLYENSRDISKNDTLTESNFSEKLKEKLSAYSSPEHKVLIVGNDEELWKNLSENAKSQLLYVLQELMVNMKKHSKASLVSVKFEKQENLLNIRYLDNGVGIQLENFYKGSGIKNMENRMESIGGRIIFEKNPMGGLVANISLPTQYV